MEKLSMAPKEDLPKFTDSKMAAPFEGMLRSDSMHSFKDKRLLLKNAKMNTPGLLAQQRKMIKEKQLKEQKKKEAQELKQKMLIGRQTLIIREDDDEHQDSSAQEDEDESDEDNAVLRQVQKMNRLNTAEEDEQADVQMEEVQEDNEESDQEKAADEQEFD